MFHKLYENWPGKGEPFEVELAIEADIDGIRWMGRVDRLERSEQGIRVVDYKTGTTPMSKDDAAESVQLGFYALAVADRGEVVASEMWYPRTKTKSVSTRSVDLHRLAQIGEKMREIGAAIAAERWDPKVSEACKGCATGAHVRPGPKGEARS
jgi:RecB family exonuclease